MTLTRALLAILLVGCVLPTTEEPTEAIFVDNQSGTTLAISAELHDRVVALDPPLEPGQSSPVIFSAGVPPETNVIFRGRTCTVVPFVAHDPDGNEVARHPPGLCLGETWTIGEGEHSPR